MSANTVHDKTGKTPPPLAPPDEKFWQRYSPHHEFPLSATTSLVMHGMVLTLMIAIGYLALKFGMAEANKPLKVDAIVIAGGGGDPDGEGEGTGNPARTEDVGEKPGVAAQPKPSEPRETLKQANTDPLLLPEYTGPDGRLLDDAGAQAERLSKLSNDTRKQLFEGLGRSKGQGGTGTGGGSGKGKGTGQGDLEGPGKGNITTRQKRVLRWTMIFNTSDGNDYRRQLMALDAILAVPEPNGDYRVIRNLNEKPARGKVEDLADIQRIFWVDDTPQSIIPLARALGLNPPPPRIVAFFPPELEAELLRLEKAYRGKEEHEIKETRFRVERLGKRYVPRVESQR